MTKRKILILICLLAVSGCGVTPERQLHNSQLIFLSTVKTINILKEAGRFDQEEIDEIKVFANAGNKILIQWEVAGGPTLDLLEAFETALAELTSYKIKGRIKDE